MEMWLRDENGQLLATMVQGRLYPAPGADRERIAFELWKAAMQCMMPGQPQVTWGTAWAPSPPGA